VRNKCFDRDINVVEGGKRPNVLLYLPQTRLVSEAQQVQNYANHRAKEGL